MKLGPVAKLDKRNMATSEKLDDDFLLANDDVFDGAIWKPAYARSVC